LISTFLSQSLGFSTIVSHCQPLSTIVNRYDKTNQKNKRYHSPKDKKNPGVIPGDPEGLIAYSREAMIPKKDNIPETRRAH
jgi:hypothetical protein